MIHLRANGWGPRARGARAERWPGSASTHHNVVPSHLCARRGWADIRCNASDIAPGRTAGTLGCCTGRCCSCGPEHRCLFTLVAATTCTYLLLAMQRQEPAAGLCVLDRSCEHVLVAAAAVFSVRHVRSRSAAALFDKLGRVPVHNPSRSVFSTSYRLLILSRGGFEQRVRCGR